MKAIVCLDRKFGIGNKNRLPWKNKQDLAHFKEYTWGHKIVMGNTTYRGLGMMFLENRHIQVLTKQPTKSACATIINNNSATTVYISENDITDNVIICGGRTVYEKYLPQCVELMVTHLNSDYDCDTFFPYSQTGINMIFPKSEIVKTIEGGIIIKYTK